MRSKEVAVLAGVSVRTLRHYHQVGVLPEPNRGANGYRTYELSHVARLLRIRTLAELGVPLERMAALLDDPADAASSDVLDGLATELEERVVRLQGQLRRITELRTSRARPDLTPVLAEFIAAAGGALELSDLAGIEEDASVLVARLYEAGGAPEDLHELAAVLGDVRRHKDYDDFVVRFEELPADASEVEVREVAETFIAAFGPAMTHVIDNAMGGRLRQLREQDVPAIDLDPRLNNAQAEVLRLIGDTL